MASFRNIFPSCCRFQRTTPWRQQFHAVPIGALALDVFTARSQTTHSGP
jgi:hypothetical protein